MAIRTSARPAREHSCWWLVARDEAGKTTLIFGSDRSEEDARQKGLEMLPGIDFEVKKLPTRNLARASSLFKGKKLERTHDLKKSMQKLRHKVRTQ